LALVSVYATLPPPTPTLFPYTTLFRSSTASAQITLRTRIGRQLLLASRQAKLAIVMSVIDNGPGVPAALHDKIFHPLVTGRASRSEEHTSELQSRENLVCRLLLEKKKK